MTATSIQRPVLSARPRLAAGSRRRLLCDSVDELLEASDVIVVGNNAAEFADALARTRPGQIVLDPVRVPCDLSRVAAEYRGLCW